ncbi:MAG: hypothetical protein CMB67_04870 [Euryarchaeota archaeon]|nr:hypothetical protein [Euryarchaeota archaeon]
MTHFRSLLLSSILVAVSLSNAIVIVVEEDNNPSSIGARNNPVDFEVTGIEIGNDTLVPRSWTQPDNGSLEYMTKGETIQINVTFQQKGVDPTPTYADAKLEIWHPIGIMIVEWDFNITLIAGASERVSFIWTPSIAHSSLSDDGWLTGGVILRGTVDAGIGIDGDETNNLLDREVPVAFWYDPMENGFCDDEANEGKFCTNSPVGYGVPTWYAAGYIDGYNPDTNNFPTGTWRMDNESSPTGEWHWKVSGDNNNYASNRYDRLTWAWQRINSQDGCSDGVANPDYSHGLGYGQHDPTLSSIHVANLCLVKIDSPALYSIQIVTDAWGAMGAGDSIMMETDSGAGGNSEFLNYSSRNLSSTEGDWERIVWNATGMHQNEGFTVSLLFRSNSSFSDEGIHIDSFIIFAIEEGEEYTLDAECSFPDNFGGTTVYDPESEGGNTILVEAADPDPPSMHCRLFNKGYVDTKLWFITEVSNTSWMSQYPLRIESNNYNDNDNEVQSNVIKARTYTDVWFNLTIPDGTPVQDLFWYTWINDGIMGFSDNKYSIELPVSVQSTYRMTMKQESLSNPAATIMPGGKANISMELKNTGNQYSSWSLGGSFSDSEIDSNNLKWYEAGGGELTILNLTPVEDILLNAEVKIPDGTSPGIYEVDLVASPRLPNTFQASSRIFIEVPVFHDLGIAPVKDRMVAPADGTSQSVQIFLFNEGNTQETFDLRVDTDNWKLLADLSSDEVTLEANGGQTTISLLLPMPQGVKNGTYRISIIATSQQNPLYQAQSNFYLTVTKTYLVGVEDRDLSEEVFAAGTDPRTLKWEIWNSGNEDDSFEIELSFPSDVSASVSGISDGKTPYIPPGSSYNLSVSYSFDSGVQGPRIIELRATSVESGEYSEAEARFEVGTVGFLLVLPPSSQSNSAEIIEPGDDYIIVFPIRSAHPELDQQIRADVELDNLWTIYDARVADDDRNFVLSAGESRNVTIHLDVRDENLDNLPQNQVQFNVSLVVISDLDTTVKTSQITLVKPDPVPEGTDVEEVGWMAANYVLALIGASFIGGILFASFRVFRSASAPLEEHSSLGDYSMTVDGWDGQKISGGDLPSADDIANSMYGGARELFEQPPPPSIPETPTSINPEGNSSPPIPDDGLPEGWTIEQWNFYGQEWLDSQREE